MPPKRKAEAVAVTEAAVATPTKRPRNSSPAPKPSESATQITDTPQTGEKRKRGRPRKFPEGQTPKPTDGPKRGRGRPRKVVSESDLAAAAAAAEAAGPKRGRGRPRKEPGSTTTTPKVTPKKKDGRGRPRKSLPANGTDTELKETTVKSKPYTGFPDESGRSYWLMKAEPESRLEKGVDVKFSIDDLEAATQPEPWDGVRNIVARNIMKDMKKGDYAFFYHSNCKVPGIVGVMEIVREYSVDESAFDTKHPYHDPKSTRDNPKWVVVHVEFRRKLTKQVTLNELKANAERGKPLENLQTLKQARLSVSSVTPEQWQFILELGGEDPRSI